MTINERLFETLKQKNIKHKTLANHLNVKQQIISNWEKRGTNPPAEYISSIAKFLNVTVIWLLTGEEADNNLTNDEAELLNKYRQMTPKDQKEIIAIIDIKLQQQKQECKILNSKIG